MPEALLENKETTAMVCNVCSDESEGKQEDEAGVNYNYKATTNVESYLSLLEDKSHAIK